MICRVCGAQTTLFQQVDWVRTEDRVLSERAFTVDTVTVDVYECAVCGHIQTENLLPADFYDTNDSSVQGYGQHIHALDTFEEKAQKLRRHTGGDALIEIGSGFGAFLLTAGKYFAHCTGVEPSNTYKSEVFKEEGNIQVVHGYFDKNIRLERDYDAFASFQVFEHLEDPLTALQLLYSVCRENAYGIINVPNGLQVFEQALYHQVILQHVNYYTPMSLCTLVQRAGFIVEELESNVAAIEINLYCRKPGVSVSMNERRAQDARHLKEYLSGKKVVIWGAGAKAITYSALLGAEVNITHIVDGDPKKSGGYIANINVPIELPSNTSFADADIVLVFATSYLDEIINRLKVEFSFTKRIVYFGERGVVLA